MRFFMHLAYDGTRYHGWQIQPNGISVEGEIERCLSTLLRIPTDIVGAGRTDAGVHARHMVAHFDVNPNVNLNPNQLAYKLNRMLPPDITIYKVEPVSEDMHARFSACKRTYHYYISTERNPFSRHYSWLCPYTLDFNKMNNAAQLLIGYQDFAAFCKSHTDVKTTLCDVTEAQWIQEGKNWYFRISANRFLRNMVRAVVGTLIEVGRGRMTIEEFRQTIESRQRTKAGESMPANALFLEHIEYDSTFRTPHQC
ncbi:MAG: tRNA pseudouridine(38-40) synthase TruA [Prevotella sp.]|nr:tRNA pseudouridine(38-40) synthase TruA [Prevotella sp.]